jgi:hypothetical protein
MASSWGDFCGEEGVLAQADYQATARATHFLLHTEGVNSCVWQESRYRCLYFSGGLSTSRISWYMVASSVRSSGGTTW